jgi:hypothetical protein
LFAAVVWPDTKIGLVHLLELQQIAAAVADVGDFEGVLA